MIAVSLLKFFIYYIKRSLYLNVNCEFTYLGLEAAELQGIPRLCFGQRGLQGRFLDELDHAMSE